MANADKLIELFSEAKARPPGVERDRFLNEACREASELREQVLILLKAHDGAEASTSMMASAGPGSAWSEP
ncbi:MAG: hypothetical protein ACKV19_19765 [Verrucomicrobiales bacterium]